MGGRVADVKVDLFVRPSGRVPLGRELDRVFGGDSLYGDPTYSLLCGVGHGLFVGTPG